MPTCAGAFLFLLAGINKRSAMAEKKETVAELKQLFAGSNAIYLTEYRGLTVTELKSLRR